MAHTIKHNMVEHQFLIDLDGKIAHLDYSVSEDGNVLNYHHTFVPEELRGQKIGDELAIFALDYAKENHLRVKPSCPFVKRIMDRHPEYNILLG